MQLRFVVSADFNARPLREFLRAQGVSATLIKGVINNAGGFWADETPIRTCDAVQTGQTVAFCLPPEGETTVKPEALPLHICYESEFALVLEKAAGMAVHPTLNYKNGTLANAYMGLLAARGEPGIFRPVNRLDKDTSGLVLCAKNSYAAAGLAQHVQKKYTAVVQGQLPAACGVISAPIGRAPGSIILRCVDPSGKPSRTEYKVTAQTDAFSLVEAVPVTGRTHQLRVHFAHLGCPLAGDELYGGSRQHITRQALHCTHMQFTEPFSGKLITVESPLPPDMAALIV